MDDPTGDEKATSPAAADVSSVSCSICLDLVADGGERSIAKLQCGHEFHLDCIGSAFNMKGVMQCPNCRKIERGRWLYASGSTSSFREFSMDDWIPDEDPYEMSYSEMPVGVHWCPFSGLARVHSSFEEVESPSTYHNLQTHHAIFAEHAAASSVAHSYVAYFGPIPAASSNTSEGVEDSNFNHPWNGLSGHNEIFAAHGFPLIDIQYQSWGPHSHPFSSNSGHSNSTNQASVPPTTRRSTRGEFDAMTTSGSFEHPFHHGHGNSWSHERTSASHTIHHQQQPNNVIPLVRRSNGPRGLVASQSDHSGGYMNFPPPTSSGQNPHGMENPLLNRIHARERNHSSHLPVFSFDRDSVWGPFRHDAPGSSDPTNWSGSFLHRHRS